MTLRKLDLTWLTILTLGPLLTLGCSTLEHSRSCPMNRAYRVLQIMNEVRAEHGAPPLEVNLRLIRAAQGHAQEVASGEASGHLGATRSTPSQRIRAAGYAYRAYGENVAEYTNSPDSVVEAWVASEGHRKVLVDPIYREVGIGIGHHQGKTVWVADFGLSKEPPHPRCHPPPKQAHSMREKAHP